MNILIIYYSMYGHIHALARAAEEGVASVPGAVPVLRQVEDFPENLARRQEGEHGRMWLEKQKDIPFVTHEDMRQAQGYIFGTPTRYGTMCAQLKRFIDSLVHLWLKGEMEGKPAGVLVSTATMHGGQETTALTTMVSLLHLGMVLMGVPYSTPGMLHVEARGGTPYGPSTVAGSDNSLVPREEDLALARFLGRRVAEATLKLRG